VSKDDLGCTVRICVGILEPAGEAMTAFPDQPVPTDAPPAADTPGEHGSLRGGSILRGSSALTVSILIVAAGGAVFWAIAARIADTGVVGQVAAISSVSSFIVYLTGLGLIPVIARYGADDSHESRVVHNAAIMGTLTAAILSALVICAVAGAASIETLDPIRSITGATTFTLIAAGASVTVLVEIRLLCQRRYRWLVGRAAATATVSIGLVSLGPVRDDPLRIFIAGSGTAALSGLVVWLLAERHDRNRFRLSPPPDDVRPILHYAAVNWTANIIGKAAATALPLVMAMLTTSEECAQFFVAWSIAIIIFVVVGTVGTTLLAHGSRSTEFDVQIRHALVLGSVLVTGIVASTMVGAPLVKLVYGSSYADAVTLLRVFSIAAIPTMLYSIANAVAQVRRTSRVIVALPSLLMVSVYIPIAVMSNPLTIMDAGASWLIGTSIAGTAGVIYLLSARGHNEPPLRHRARTEVD
jgi:O-antigen/teichoic acid export membrane protein